MDAACALHEQVGSWLCREVCPDPVKLGLQRDAAECHETCSWGPYISCAVDLAPLRLKGCMSLTPWEMLPWHEVAMPDCPVHSGSGEHHLYLPLIKQR